MERRYTTPPPEPGSEPAWDDLYAGTGESEPAGEDWGARYGGAPPPPPRRGLDLSAIFLLLDGLRRAAPAELQERVTALIREALLTLRSLIDLYLERLDRTPGRPRVEDIPID